MTYFPPDTQNGTIDPWPPTIIIRNDSSYEYARRYGTLEDPPDLGSIATGKFAILGIATSPTFFKSIDILPSIGSSVTQYVSVHSEPTLYDASLLKVWHFRADSLISDAEYEFGHSFTRGSTDNSYGFYYGSNVGVATTGYWGVFIDDEVSNYFDDLVLVGRTVPIKINNTITPIVQIFNNNDKSGLYVQGNVDIGGNLKVGGSGDIDSTLNVGARLTVESGGYGVTGNSNITGTLNVTSTVTAPTFVGNVTGTASGNKLLAAFDIPHVKKKGKRIRHIITEGPEAGIYIRGKLKDSNVIELPEYWDGLIDPETITVSHVVYEGETPDDYPGNNDSFLVGGWDYDKRNPQWS